MLELTIRRRGSLLPLVTEQFITEEQAYLVLDLLTISKDLDGEDADRLAEILSPTFLAIDPINVGETLVDAHGNEYYGEPSRG